VCLYAYTFLVHDLYCTRQKFENFTFLMFLKDSYAHQACVSLIKNTEKNCNIVKYYYNLK